MTSKGQYLFNLIMLCCRRQIIEVGLLGSDFVIMLLGIPTYHICDTLSLLDYTVEQFKREWSVILNTRIITFL